MKKSLIKVISILMVIGFFLILAYPMKDVEAAVTNSIVSLGGGCDHSLMIMRDRSLWAWGLNNGGQLGDGTTTDRLTPGKILDNVRQVSGGYDHTLAIKNDGSLWAWGLNGVGTVGDGTTTDRYSPVKVMTDVKKVSARFGRSLALKKDGSMWAWGFVSIGNQVVTSNIPVKISDGIKDIAAGDSEFLAIKKDGSVWQWSNFIDGTASGELKAVKVPLNGVIKIGAGNCSNIALRKDGTVWMWNSQSYNEPRKLDISGVRDISAGVLQNLALKSDGSLWSWGRNNTDKPVQILTGVIRFESAIAHGFAIKKDGTVWAWGRNLFGQLGDGTTIDRNEPVQVFLSPATGVKLNKSSLRLWAGGKSETLTATVIPSDAFNKKLSWSSDNPNVAVVDNGVVIGVSKGTATITVRIEDDSVYATCKVIVLDKDVRRLIASENNIRLKPGDSRQIKLTAVYDDGSKADVTTQALWNSSNSGVATVDGGVVTTSSDQFGAIKVTAELEGKKAVIQVTNAIKAIIASETKVIAKPGLDKQITLMATYADGSTGDVTYLANWSSNEESVVSVSQGNIRIKEVPKMTVTVITEYGGKKAKILVRK